MQAYVLHGIEDLRKEERRDPVVGDDDVLIRVRRVGICGSDVHYYRHYRIGSFVPQAPLVLGHEFAGDVVAVGKSVTAFSEGDRVTAEPSIECRKCAYCRSGRYNLCTNLKFCGTAATVPHIDGGFGEYVSMPARNCYLLPKNLDYGAGALVEPMAVGAHAVMRAGNIAGKRVLITGGGTIGQMVLAVAAVVGAGEVTIADPDAYAREFSLAHGASSAVDPTEEGIADRLFRDGGYEVLFEAAGNPNALSFCYQVAARGAKLVQVGTQPDSVTLPINLLMSKELDVFGSFRYAHVYPMVLNWMAKGQVALDDLISVVYPYEKFQEAMDRAVEKKNVVKVQVEQGVS